MTKYGLYTKNQAESTQHINLITMPSISQAEAYFAGVKNLSLTQLQELFIVKEINQSDKTLLYGNR
tara:strand:- start:138 stop:335 length:198 start_codon:yes stop_codon:yes gene_type:complete